ncbi:MAG TPA: YraN family protein [Clostridiales bacterium]|nr:YraN family protein [Clostridiales bacterium]
MPSKKQEDNNNNSFINKRELGSFGENIAVDYLTKNNFIILERNYRYGRFGEIDIIARENEYICFIEVKTRSSNLFGTPSEAVNIKKQNSIKTLAQIYLKQMDMKNKNLRFDIVEILIQYNGLAVKCINLIRNAF